MQVVKDLKSVGSTISLEDMKNYRAREVKAVESDFPGVKGLKVYTVPPPAGGVALLNILNILKGMVIFFIALVEFQFQLPIIVFNIHII